MRNGHELVNAGDTHGDRITSCTQILKHWEFQIVVLEQTLESPLDCKEIKPVSPKENQCRIFIGRTDAEAEAPLLWPPDAKNWLIGKEPDAGKDWGQEEKEMTEDEMVGWHHRLDGHEFEQTLGDSEGQRSLVCCSPWGHKKSDMTEQLNKSSLNDTTEIKWTAIESSKVFDKKLTGKVKDNKTTKELN